MTEPTRLTEAELERLLDLSAQVPDGPWSDTAGGMVWGHADVLVCQAHTEHEGRYIAAVSPDVVRALVEEVQRLRQEADEHDTAFADLNAAYQELLNANVDAAERERLSVTVTSTAPVESSNGFDRTIVFYRRGPNDPYGSSEQWICDECWQREEQGHLATCSKREAPHADA